MSESTQKKNALEIVEPIGKRVLIRKDDDKKKTKSGIHLPDKVEIPTLTGRVVSISTQIDSDEDYPIQQYDRVLFNPKEAIPVDFEGDNRLFVVPIENIVACSVKRNNPLIFITSRDREGAGLCMHHRNPNEKRFRRSGNQYLEFIADHHAHRAIQSHDPTARL